MIKYKVINEDGSTYETLEMPTSGVFETIEELSIEIVNVPTQISRMKFIIQVFLTTGIMYEDIVLFVQNLNFDEAQKYVILTRLKSATHFDRNSNDLLTISAMISRAPCKASMIFFTSFSSFTYCKASASKSKFSCNRIFCAKGSKPFSRAMVAFVLRFGL